MFGSIGFPELIMIFMVVLLVFGPKKLPEFAKLLGKTIREFRSTVDEAKAAIENEIYKEGLTSELKDIGKGVKDAMNITSDLDKPMKDIGKDIRDALNGTGPIHKTSGESKRGSDDEKSE